MQAPTHLRRLRSQAIRPQRASPYSPSERPRYSTRPLVVHHARPVQGLKWKIGLMRPCHDRINQFAAFDEVVQDRTYFMQFLAAQPAGHGRRRLTRSCWRSVLQLLDRLIDGTARVKRAICGFDMWHRRIHHRRVNSRFRINLTVAQITANQRGQPAANSAFFLKEGFDRLVLFVFLTLDDAMGRLRRALFPHFLHELRALLAQNSLHAADGVTLAVKQVAYPPQEVDVVRPIVAASSATFHRLNFMEAALPKTQHVLR